MNVLQIIQGFCFETNLPPPTTLIGINADPATLQLIHLFYAVGRDLRQAKCWPQLKRTHTFSTVNGVNAYQQPADFFCSILDTYWDTTNRWKMSGPQTDAAYNELLYGYATLSNRVYFRIFGRQGEAQFKVQPTPGTSVINLQYDYVSSYWIRTGSVSFVWSETIQDDADICAFDDDLMILGLKYRWYQMKGLDFSNFKVEYDNKISAAMARFQGSKKTSLFQEPTLIEPNIPEGSWTL